MLIETDNPDGSIYKTSYDWLGRKVSATDPKGNVTTIPNTNNTYTYTYDGLGNLTHEENPFQVINGTNYKTKKDYTYDAAGNLTIAKVTNGLPGQTSVSETDYVYNNRNFLQEVKALNGVSVENDVTYTYDNAGNKLSMTTMTGSGANGTTYYDYDNRGRLTRLTDPTGKYEQYKYDNNNNLINKTDRNGNTTVNTYDLTNRLTSVTVTPPAGAPSGVAASSIIYAYAITGLKTSESNENLSSVFIYDDAGRLVSQTDKTSQASGSGTYSPAFTAVTDTKTYQYDIHDNRSTFTLTQNDVRKQYVSYYYDKMNRLHEAWDQLTSTFAMYDYDLNGNRLKLTYSNGNTTDYIYNDANLVINLTNKVGGAVSSKYDYEYNLDGNQNKKTETINGLVRPTTYTYDPLGRLLSETETTLAGNYGSASAGYTSPYTLTTLYTYDKANNRKSMTVQAAGGSTHALAPLGLAYPSYTDSYTYDANNRLLTETKQPNTPSSPPSNPAADTSQPKEVTTYTYDLNGNQLSKLTGEQATTVTGTSSVLGLSLVGQTPIVPYGVSAANMPGGTSYPGTPGAASSFGVSNIYNSTPNHNAVIESYTYDVFNRLIKTQNEQDTITYRYNPDGLRLNKTLVNYDSVADTINSYTTTDIWDGSNIALELTQRNNPSAVSASAPNGITMSNLGYASPVISASYFRGVNLIKASFINQDIYSTPGSKTYGQIIDYPNYFYLYNAHGDVVQLTDTAGMYVLKNYHYNAFGVEDSYYQTDGGNVPGGTVGVATTTRGADPKDANIFRYCGEMFDRDLGTIYLRARYYQPSLGRFLTQDEWGYSDPRDPLSLNLYTYCSNNPIYLYDSSGHDNALSEYRNTKNYMESNIGKGDPVIGLLILAHAGNDSRVMRAPILASCGQ